MHCEIDGWKSGWWYWQNRKTLSTYNRIHPNPFNFPFFEHIYLISIVYFNFCLAAYVLKRQHIRVRIRSKSHTNLYHSQRNVVIDRPGYYIARHVHIYFVICIGQIHIVCSSFSILNGVLSDDCSACTMRSIISVAICAVYYSAEYMVFFSVSVSRWSLTMCRRVSISMCISALYLRGNACIMWFYT